MNIDTNDLRLNPAKFPAIGHAHYRARRDQKTMHVYVGPPGVRTCCGAAHAVNAWFVRPADEPPPSQTQLFEVVKPH